MSFVQEENRMSNTDRVPREQRVYLALHIKQWRDSVLGLMEGMGQEAPPKLDEGRSFGNAIARLREAHFWLGEALMEAASQTGDRGMILFAGPDAADERVSGLSWHEAIGGADYGPNPMESAASQA